MDSFQQDLLRQVAEGTLTVEEATKLFSQKRPKGISFEVSPKGAVKIVGLRKRFPVVLFANELQAILQRGDEILQFIEANKDKLSLKPGDKVQEEDQADAA